ncbi:MAG: family 16 glycoside hydrolase [Opitutales bacterium]
MKYPESKSWFRQLIAAGALSLLSFTASIAETPTYLSEDFEGSEPANEWDASSGWFVADGVYAQDLERGIQKTFSGDAAWTDYTYSLDLATASDLTQRIYVASAVFRVTDPKNLYEVRLTRDGKLELHSIVFGVRTTLASTSTGYSPMDWNTLKVDVVGSSISVSLQGETLLEVVNEDHPVGYIGLRTRGTKALFDNVSVVGPVEEEADVVATFLGHSFFRPSANQMMQVHYEEIGIFPEDNVDGGPESELFFAGGPKGHPLALWDNDKKSAEIKAKLDEGETEILGMTYFPETDPFLGIKLPKFKGYDSVKGYRNWVNYAVNAGNPLKKVFIAIPWSYEPATISLSWREDVMWPRSRKVIHKIIDKLRDEFPGIEFVSNPYGLGAFELEKMFDNGDLAEDGIIYKFDGGKSNADVSIYVDPLGHGGDILDAVTELIWLYGIFGVDLDTYEYEHGFNADLNQIAIDIVDDYSSKYGEYSGR